MRSKTKNIYKALFRICFSLILLIWLLSKADLRSILETFLQLPLSTWALAVFLFISLCTLAASRWFILSRTLDFPGQWFTYVGYYFIGQFFNLFLPTSIGGDVFKIMFISRGKQKKMIATYSVMADRFCGLAAMLLMGAGAVLLSPDNMLPKRLEWLLYIGAIGIIGLFIFLPLIYRLIDSSWPNISKRLTILLTIWRRPVTFFKLAALSVGLNFILITILIMLAEGVGINLPPAYYFAIFPLTAIVTILPISFNGIGLREGAFVYLLSLQNVPLEKALPLSLCFFVIQCSGGLAGGIAYATGLHKKKIY